MDVFDELETRIIESGASVYTACEATQFVRELVEAGRIGVEDVRHIVLNFHDSVTDVPATNID